MRALRLSVVGTVSLVLFGGVSSAVYAQPEVEVATGSDYAWVTLVSETDCSGAAGAHGVRDGIDWVRGNTFTCDLEFSDPRVSGVLTGAYNDDCFGDDDEWACLYWNSEEISGPDGDWIGGVWGTIRMDDPEAASLKVFRGTDAYEGLNFLVHGLGVLGEQDFYGLIYEGNLPPMPGLVPAE